MFELQGSVVSLSKKTLSLLLSTGWFQDRFECDLHKGNCLFHIETKMNLYEC